MTASLTFGALVLGDHDPATLRRMARNCEAWGYDYLWLADERFFRDVYASLAVCALETSRIRLGTGVTDPYSRHPALTAVGIATIDELSNGRAVLGIGAGIAGLAEMGIAQTRPARAIREAVEFIRRFLSNEPVSYDGEIVHFDDGILSVPSRPDLPVFIAGKGPMNIQLAGELADGLIISSCVADASIDETLRLLANGARRGSRDPSSVVFASRVNVAVSDDGDQARQVVKPMLAALLVSKKPDFSFLGPLGLTMPPDLAAVVDATRYGHGRDQMRKVAERIPDDFVAALAVAGTPDEVEGSISRMARRGVTQFIAYPMPCPGQPHEDVLQRLAEEVMPKVRTPDAGIRQDER